MHVCTRNQRKSTFVYILSLMHEKYPILRSLRNAFFTGIIILAPLAVSFAVFMWLTNNIGGRFSDYLLYFVPDDWLARAELRAVWNVLATFIVFLIVTFLGYLSRYFVGRWFINMTESVLNRVPFVNTVYKTVKQIVDTFSTENRAVFKKVVLIEYPRKGVWVIGFLTSNVKGEPQALTQKNLKNIFVPTTPNPTSGFLLMVDEDEIKELKMSVGDGMKLIISGGAVVPHQNFESSTADPISTEPQKTIEDDDSK